MVLPITTQSKVNQSNLTIFEFSRQLLEPQWSERFNQYVSTGFDKEIGFKTQPVPQEIRDAVYNNQFRLNDNYPLPKGEFALVARELNNYSVLAVAIQLFDEYSRPLIGYRYFCLEHNTNFPDFDGIATILNWWETQGKPFLNLQPSSLYLQQLQTHLATDYYQVHPVFKEAEAKVKFNSYEKFQEIVSFPHILLVDDNHEKESDYHQLHQLALNSNHHPISWCWNANQLEEPHSFLVIAYATNWAFERHKKRYPSPNWVSQPPPSLSSQDNETNSSQSLTVFQKVFAVLALVLKASNTLHYEKNGIIIDYDSPRRVLTFTQDGQKLIGLFSLEQQWEYIDGLLSSETFTFITTTVKTRVVSALSSQAPNDSLLIHKASSIFADFLKSHNTN